MGRRRPWKQLPRTPNWQRDRSTSGSGTKSGKNSVLMKLNVCAWSSSRWTKPKLQNGNSNNWVAKLMHLTLTATNFLTRKTRSYKAIKISATVVSQMNPVIGTKRRYIPQKAPWTTVRSTSSSCLHTLRLFRNLVCVRWTKKDIIRNSRPNQAVITS